MLEETKRVGPFQSVGSFALQIVFVLIALVICAIFLPLLAISGRLRPVPSVGSPRARKERWHSRGAFS